MTTTKDTNHAERNARAYIQSIIEMYKGYKALTAREADSVTADGVDFDDAEKILEHAQEIPLEVQVRSGWHSPGAEAEDRTPEEYKILMSTGGPALRIVGDLTQHGDPTDPRLEYQDWGTPWTPHHSAEDDAEEALDWFVNQFYFAG